MKLRIFVSLAALVTVALSSCSYDPHINAAQTRGAVGGAAVGAIIGNNSGGIGKGEAAAAGAIIGALMSENRLRARDPNMVGRR